MNVPLIPYGTDIFHFHIPGYFKTIVLALISGEIV
jgi:hypothetical protein